MNYLKVLDVSHNWAFVHSGLLCLALLSTAFHVTELFEPDFSNTVIYTSSEQTEVSLLGTSLCTFVALTRECCILNSIPEQLP